MERKLELLAPAGSFETLKAVVYAGADAVYFGGSKFGARAYAGNLTKEEVLEAIDFGHIHGRKMFLAINTLFKEREQQEQLYEYLLPFYERGLDAVIVQDYGVFRFVRENFRELPVHTSTQMTVMGPEGARFLEKEGAARIVLAREMSLEEIRTIRQAVSVELESFVHGALCYSCSGQCLFSSMLGGRSGNRGRCAQPCRLPYAVGSERQSYLLSPKDLCTIDLIPDLAKSGIDSFKIEGRMKQTEYAAGVVSVYRKYMDRYFNYGEEGYHVEEKDWQKLFDLGNRGGFTEGYYNRKNGPDMITFSSPRHEKKKEPKQNALQECTRNITGIMKIRKGAPTELSVSFSNITVTVNGDVPETAQNQPLTEETLRFRLQKTGNTPFVFDTLDIQAEEGLFLSASSVNDLRRRALGRLEDSLLEGYQRTAEKPTKKAERKRNASALGRTVFNASAETEEQIASILKSRFISGIYVDGMAFEREKITEKMDILYEKAHRENKRLYYILPAVFRSHTALFYKKILRHINADGFLVKSYDALEFLLEQGILADKIRIDHTLYTWSNESRQAFFELGITADTIPLELNRNEIRCRNNENSEMLIYGYLPLMTSVQCIQKNLFGCTRKPGVHELKDRYGISFSVKNHCGECYNTIYNSRPLILAAEEHELCSYGICAFRLSFTVENGSQTAQVLRIFEEHQLFDMTRATYGHYKRGVE